MGSKLKELRVQENRDSLTRLTVEARFNAYGRVGQAELRNSFYICAQSNIKN